MLQNLTNFFNLIRTRKIKTQLADNDLIAVGTRDNTWGGNYQPTAITFEDLAAQIRIGSPNFVSTGTFSTNSLTDVILTSILIPANTYSSTDAFTTAFQITKPAGFNGFGTLHVNTVNSLVGASQLATVNGTSTITIFSLQRTYYIDGLNTYSFPVTTNNVTDVGLSTNPLSITNIDWTQNQYIIVAGRVDNAAFSVTCKGIRIY